MTYYPLSRAVLTVKLGWGRELWLDRLYRVPGVQGDRTSFIYWRTGGSWGGGCFLGPFGVSLRWANVRIIRDPNYMG